METIEQIIASSPDNFVIRDALVKCYDVVSAHNNIECSISGGVIPMLCWT